VAGQIDRLKGEDEGGEEEEGEEGEEEEEMVKEG